MRSASSLARPVEALMVIFCSLLVARSLAETFRMPLASISKVTSICGMPRGADRSHLRYRCQRHPERNFDLRHATGRRRDADQMEFAERAVVERQRPFALQNVDLDRSLIISGGGEDLRLPRGDGRVARGEHNYHTAQGSHAQLERGNAEQTDC